LTAALDVAIFRAEAEDDHGQADLGRAQGMAGQLTNLDHPGPLRRVHAIFRQRSTAQLLATAARSSSPWLPEGYMQNFRQAA
jgi:hypothetical protein